MNSNHKYLRSTLNPNQSIYSNINIQQPKNIPLNRPNQSPTSLRNTYSPVISKSNPNLQLNYYHKNYNWNNQSRISGFSNNSRSFKMGKSDSNQPKSLSNLENKLNYLEQCVNKAKKQLQEKNLKKNDMQQEDHNNEKKLYEGRNDRFKKQKNYIYHKNQNDLKATIKIPQLSQLVSRTSKPKQINGFNLDPYSPRKHNIYYVSSLIRGIDQKNSIAKEHVKTSIQILKLLQNVQIPSFSQIQQKKLNLKKHQKYKDKKTIVFDLDQTLIHCNQNSQLPSDIKLTIKLQNGQFTAGINIRPYAMSLLNQLVKKFQLMIFTASHSSYANVVLDFLDPQKTLFQHRLYREHCYYSQAGMYIKDIRIINRNINDLILIDNAAYSYAFQLQNGVPILNYYDGQDFQLKQLHKYLDRINLCKDVRQINKKTFKLHHYTKFNTPQQLIQQLYMQN